MSRGDEVQTHRYIYTSAHESISDEHRVCKETMIEEESGEEGRERMHERTAMALEAST